MSTKQPIWPSGRFGVPQITPFTYRDGHTHMELIEALRDHLVERLHPSLVATVNSLVEQMEREYGKALDQYVNGVEEFQRIHDRFMSDVNGALIALNDTAVTDLVDDATSLFGQSIRQLVRRENVAQVVVGEGREYATILDVFEDHPNGNVVIHLDDGVHQTTTLPKDANLKNVTIQGNGREVATVEVDGPFIETVLDQDMWTLKDFTLVNTNPINTDNGIDVDYPRRWDIENLEITGFGGDTIYYRGGLNSRISGTLIIARDTARVNGNSGIRIGRRFQNQPDSAATTHITERNYIQGGHQYGFLFEYHSDGGVSISDIAEHCAVGFCFRSSPMVVISPYGEANDQELQVIDSAPIFLGRMLRIDRDPDIVWSGMNIYERAIARIANGHIVPGRGIFYSPSGFLSDEDDAYPSIRWDTVTPNNRRGGVPGSIMFSVSENNPTDNRLWLKRYGTDREGWEALGVVTATTAELHAAGHRINDEGKFHGSMVFDIRTNRALYAHGPEPTDPWGDGNGEVVITPS